MTTVRNAILELLSTDGCVEAAELHDELDRVLPSTATKQYRADAGKYNMFVKMNAVCV